MKKIQNKKKQIFMLKIAEIILYVLVGILAIIIFVLIGLG